MLVYVRKEPALMQADDFAFSGRSLAEVFVNEGVGMVLACERLRHAMPWRRNNFSENYELAKRLIEYLKGCNSDEAAQADYARHLGKLAALTRSALEAEYYSLATSLGVALPLPNKKLAKAHTVTNSDVLTIRHKSKIKAENMVQATDTPNAYIPVTKEAVGCLDSATGSVQVILEMLQVGLVR